MQNETSPKISDIKSYLYERIGQAIESNGYKFRKSSFSFVRKNKDGEQRIFFLYYSFPPVEYEFQFFLKIVTKEIQAIKCAFPSEQNIDNFNFATLIMPMGDFVPDAKLKELARKSPTKFIIDGSTGNYISAIEASNTAVPTRAQVAGFTYRISSGKDLFKGAEEIANMIHGNVLPLADQMSTVMGVDKFFVDHSKWSVESLSLNNIISELTASKINRCNALDEVYRKIKDDLKAKVSMKIYTEKAMDVVDQYYNYLKLNQQ